VLLAVGAGMAAWALSTVRPANFGVTRMIGAPYIVDRDYVRNQFLVRIVNKRTEPERFVLELDVGGAVLRRSGFTGEVEVPPLGEAVQPLVLQEARTAYAGPFPFGMRLRAADGSFEIVRRAKFLGPDVRLLREDDEDGGGGAGGSRP